VRTPRSIAALLAASAAALAGCGGDDARPGTLTVDERWADGPHFIEGHVAFASIGEPDGRNIAHGSTGPPEDDRPILVRRLEPGRYRVSGYVRSCAPACPPHPADPPSHICSATITVDGDTAVDFVRDHDRLGCYFEIRQ
jgi:hypothetical protein